MSAFGDQFDAVARDTAFRVAQPIDMRMNRLAANAVHGFYPRALRQRHAAPLPVVDDLRGLPQRLSDDSRAVRFNEGWDRVHGPDYARPVFMLSTGRAGWLNK